MKLTTKLLNVLKQYEDTSDSRFMQGIPGSTELYSLRLLEWHGDQYGTHFYSITPTGLAALGNLAKLKGL